MAAKERGGLSDLGQTAGNTAAMAKTLEAQAKTLHRELDKATETRRRSRRGAAQDAGAVRRRRRCWGQ
jgi:hypothetical protein